MTTSQTIEYYAGMEIYIEVLVNCYKFGPVCWRGYVHHKSGGEWAQADCGCLPDWEDAFKLCVNYIETWIHTKN